MSKSNAMSEWRCGECNELASSEVCACGNPRRQARRAHRGYFWFHGISSTLVAYLLLNALLGLLPADYDLYRQLWPLLLVPSYYLFGGLWKWREDYPHLPWLVGAGVGGLLLAQGLVFSTSWNEPGYQAKLGDYERALELTGASIDPYDCYARARYYRELGRQHDALRELRWAARNNVEGARLQKDAGPNDYREALGKQWASMGAHSKAIEVFQELLRHSPDALNLRLEVVASLLALDRSGEALAGLNAVPDWSHMQSRADVLKCEVLIKLEKYDELAATLEEARMLSSTSQPRGIDLEP